MNIERIVMSCNICMYIFRSEDMRRAALLHEAFSVYMRSTAVATGFPIPTSCCDTSTTQAIKLATSPQQNVDQNVQKLETNVSSDN